jgi:hypothetical protein
MRWKTFRKCSAGVLAPSPKGLPAAGRRPGGGRRGAVRAVGGGGWREGGRGVSAAATPGSLEAAAAQRGWPRRVLVSRLIQPPSRLPPALLRQALPVPAIAARARARASAALPSRTWAPGPAHRPARSPQASLRRAGRSASGCGARPRSPPRPRWPSGTGPRTTPARGGGGVRVWRGEGGPRHSECAR